MKQDKPQHTPGPWRFDGICYIFGPNDEMIADTEVEETPGAVLRMRGIGAQLPIEANARLAAAAPELLAACESMMAAFASGAVMVHPGYVDVARCQVLAEIKKLQDAVRAARGQ
jgi:hypothetical protein